MSDTNPQVPGKISWCEALVTSSLDPQRVRQLIGEYTSEEMISACVGLATELASIREALVYLCDLKTMKEALEEQGGQTLQLPGGPAERITIETYYAENRASAWAKARRAIGMSQDSGQR